MFLTAMDTFFAQSEYHRLYGVPYEKMIPIKNVCNRGKFNLLSSLANEIAFHNIPGSVAELGVNHGDTAIWINIFFPDRTFYLFDTFTDFDKRDVVF